MIALQAQRPGGFFREAAAGLGVRVTFVDHFPVVHDFDKDGVRDLLTLSLKRGARKVTSKVCHWPGGNEALTFGECPSTSFSLIQRG